MAMAGNATRSSNGGRCGCACRRLREDAAGVGGVGSGAPAGRARPVLRCAALLAVSVSCLLPTGSNAAAHPLSSRQQSQGQPGAAGGGRAVITHHWQSPAGPAAFASPAALAAAQLRPRRCCASAGLHSGSGLVVAAAASQAAVAGQQRGRKRGRKPKRDPFISPSPASQPNAEFFQNLHATTRLLTPEEEKKLGELVQGLVAWEERREALKASLGRDPTLRELAEDAGVTDSVYESRLRRGYWAKRTMVACNLRLVVSLAAKFQGQGLPLSDLIQEGAVGLVRAVEKFDPTRGFRFSTYATWWVRQRLHLSVRNARLVRVPVRMHNQYDAVRRAVRSLAAELGRPPTELELAERVGLTPARIADVRAAMMVPESLDRELHFSTHRSEQGLVTMLDVTPLEDVTAGGGAAGGAAAATMEQALEWDMLREDIDAAMRRALSQRERDIVRMRVGLDDGRAKTATELADVFQLPAYAILREERNALTKLRVAPETARLRDYAELLNALA